jgi:predicted ATPase/DNA-binding SARP family transcriptional activator/tetratricopeptide (TPR) repeat protein
VTAALAIRVLGPLELERAGETVTIRSSMQRRLLTALVLARGELVSTDRLVEALWGTDPPPSARNSLQTYVARLRDALHDPRVVVTGPTGYALDASRVTVDAWDFEDLVRRRRGSPGEADAVVALQEGLASWRGDAYAEFADGFAREAATHLDDLRLEAAELLAAVHLRAGRPVEALSVIDGLLPAAAMRESVALLRARALAAAGRLPDALATLRGFRERLAEELGLDASPAVDALEQQLLRGELTPAADPASTAAERASAPIAPPRLATRTVGRDEDLDRVRTALEMAPLVTLVGPGGVGKTRLAMVVGHRAGRVAWVDLAPVRHDDDLPSAFAEGLGITVPAGTVVRRAVTDALAGFDGVVVVDNCEHVLDAVADLLDDALTASGPVRILATSRERLDLGGEIVIPLAPLRTPRPAEATSDDPAVQLFLDRLAAIGGGDVDPAEVAEVVAAVDGLPLAIELAAARAVSLPLGDLAARLRGRIDVLAGTRRRHGDRHRTMERVIGWSHELLRPSDRLLFRRLSVFTATFRLVDVEVVCADAEVPREEVASCLARLVEASMVVRLPTGRFRLLEPLRLYAAARLAGSAEAAEVHERQRHAALELTARADAAVSGPDELALVTEVEHALPDLRAVHARAIEQDDLATVATMTGQLYRFAYLQARSDVLLWGAALAGGVGTDVPDDDRARALAAAATGAWLTGEVPRAVELATAADQLASDAWSRVTITEVLGDVMLAAGELDAAVAGFTDNRACAERIGHAGLAANAQAGLSFAVLQRGDRDLAASLARSAAREAAACGSPSVQALAAYTLGEVLASDDPDEALAAFARARAFAVAGRARFQEGLARTADVALRGRHGPPDEALRRYRDALELWRGSGAEGFLLTVLRNLIVLLVRTGADVAALQIHSMTERLATKPSYGDEAQRLEAAVAVACERLGPDAQAVVADTTTHVRDLSAAADVALALLTTSAKDAPPSP